jgi:hypothetical protein
MIDAGARFFRDRLGVLCSSVRQPRLTCQQNLEQQ